MFAASNINPEVLDAAAALYPCFRLVPPLGLVHIFVHGEEVCIQSLCFEPRFVVQNYIGGLLCCSQATWGLNWSKLFSFSRRRKDAILWFPSSWLPLSRNLNFAINALVETLRPLARKSSFFLLTLETGESDGFWFLLLFRKQDPIFCILALRDAEALTTEIFLVSIRSRLLFMAMLLVQTWIISCEAECFKKENWQKVLTKLRLKAERSMHSASFAIVPFGVTGDSLLSLLGETALLGCSAWWKMLRASFER